MSVNLQLWRDTEYIFQYMQSNPRVFILIYCEKDLSESTAKIEKIRILENRTRRIILNVDENGETPSVDIGETVRWEVGSFVFTWDTSIDLPGDDQNEAMTVGRARPKLERESEGMLPLRF